jgi:chromosome segregation ATPase
LKAQKDAEDESTRIFFGNLRSEVIDLRHQAVEKYNILISIFNKLKESRAELTKFSEEEGSKILKLEDEKNADTKRITDLKSMLSAQVESHRSEILKMKEKLEKVNENFDVEKGKREIAEVERDKVQKKVEELQTSNEQCFSIAAHCCEKLKSMFASVGAFSNGENFVHGEAVGAIRWIEGEIKAFDDEVLTGRGDFCACVGA